MAKINKKALNNLLGNTISSIEFEPGYCSIEITFTDGTELGIYAEDAFDFRVLVNDVSLEEE